ncbi:MFS transporter permease [Phenylobacterium aquaticum]|uniref:MFS transporter permease n=1 Tax=Phenylobacterium aquaticum TaxID=1763816 RepID=UPI001F5D9D04|nr:MFS transporter permease [Phenylobacterium aquaticum]MCI3132825.1 MFS transporter permease [Phenylobacterium aquaticum]
MASALAVFAWAACCVLPLALSVAGLSLAGTAWIAGERRWLTGAAMVVLAMGWWSAIRRRRHCDLDARCAPPSPLSFTLLGAATLLAMTALAWSSLVEPRFLALLRAWR